MAPQRLRDGGGTESLELQRAQCVSVDSGELVLRPDNLALGGDRKLGVLWRTALLPWRNALTM